MRTSVLLDCILAAALLAIFSANAGCEAASNSTPEQASEDMTPNTSKLQPAGHSSDVPARADSSRATDCSDLVGIASAYGLPSEFFARLIRQESDFDPKSVSRAGAQGIAQFMPGTARWRGLSDPFEPIEALRESARWLRELRDQFGNLGLAAAAYNAGPQRVRDWLAGRGQLPNETRAYVRIITGRPAEEWIGAKETLPDGPTGNCMQAAKLAAPTVERPSADPNANLAPWGLQLIGDSSESRALSEYAALQKRYRSVLVDRAPTVLKKPLGGHGPSTWYLVRVAESTHERAMQLCSKLKSAGGSCIVTRN